MCALQGMARDGIDSHHANLLARYGLGDDTHITHEKQLARNARGGRALQLYHIGTDGQRGQVQHAVEQLVVLVHAQLNGLCQVGLRCDNSLEVVLIVVLAVGVIREISAAFHGVDTYRHTRDAPHARQLNVVPLSGGHHMLVHVGMVLQGY